ncbi:MAG TPA: Flp pilus assembly protein CpaB [Bryobacteraceae bacterium]|nr:Flp pilus assembly protein CpaB [Bryobacteraceae bacterium]
MERKKILTIFVAAWISAGLLTWFLYASTKTPRVEKTSAIQAAAHDMPAGTLLRKGDLKTVRVIEKDAPKDAIVNPDAALNHPLLYPVTANEPITTSEIAGATGIEGLAAIIEIGKRAISVPITDSSGVAGLIQPRAHVDVLFTKPGSAVEAVTTTILEDVVVLAMGRATETASATPVASSIAQAPRTASQSATLLVTPDQARKLELAKNEGKISLALRNPLDHSLGDRGTTTSKELYPVPPAAPKPERIEPTKVIVEKQAPPKPKSVVEVFRGDKHVQEVFP